jgi:hypothetical protein
MKAEDGEVTTPSAPVITVVTDKNGRYSLENVAPGRYLVMAGPLDAPTYFPGVLNPAKATALTIVAGGRWENLNLRLAVFPKVSGRVVREGHSKGTTIMLTRSSGNQSASIAPDGRFEFVDVKPGTYGVLVSPGVGSLPDTVVVEDHDIGGLEIPVPLSLVTDATVRITIVGDESGPLPPLRLQFTAVAPETAAKAQPQGIGSIVVFRGSSTVTRLRPGKYDVRGYSPSLSPPLPLGFFIKAISNGSTDLLKEPFTVTAGASPEVVVTVGAPSPSPWIKIRGRITGLEAAQAKPTRITLTSANSADVTAEIRPDGAFDFPKVLPGSYSVLLTPQADNIPRNIVVNKTGTTSFEIPMFIQGKSK